MIRIKPSSADANYVLWQLAEGERRREALAYAAYYQMQYQHDLRRKAVKRAVWWAMLGLFGLFVVWVSCR